MHNINKIILYILVAMVFEHIGIASANIQNNTVEADAFLYLTYMNSNYGQYNPITVGTYNSIIIDEGRGIFRANFSGVPEGSTINHVDYWFYIVAQNYISPTTQPITFYNITNNWDESIITWNNQPTNNEIIDTYYISTPSGWKNIDITSYASYIFLNSTTFSFKMITGALTPLDNDIASKESIYKPYISINYIPPIPPVINISYWSNDLSNTQESNISIEQGKTIRFNITTNLIIDHPPITSCGSGNLVSNGTINTTDYYIDCKYNTIGTTYANISVTNTSTSTSDYKNWTVTVNSISTKTPNILRGVTSINVTSNPFIWRNNMGHDTILIITDGVISDISFSADGITYYTGGIKEGYFYFIDGEYISVSYKSTHSVPTIVTIG